MPGALDPGGQDCTARPPSPGAGAALRWGEAVPAGTLFCPVVTGTLTQPRFLEEKFGMVLCFILKSETVFPWARARQPSPASARESPVSGTWPPGEDGGGQPGAEAGRPRSGRPVRLCDFTPAGPLVRTRPLRMGAAGRGPSVPGLAHRAVRPHRAPRSRCQTRHRVPWTSALRFASPGPLPRVPRPAEVRGEPGQSALPPGSVPPA